MSIEAMRQALEYVQEFKRRWWAVPPFGNKVNKATREAVSAAHSPIFQIEDALRAAIEQAEKPVAWMYDFLADNRDEVIRDWMTQDYADITRENGFNVRPLYPGPRQEQPLKIDPAGCHIRVGEVSEPISVGYDQTSLELCKECGWKALIPGDGCLVCARQRAKPVAQYSDIISDGGLDPRNKFDAPSSTAPRQWVELTDDEARALVNRATFGDRTNWQALVYMVDARLKEKNRDQ